MSGNPFLKDAFWPVEYTGEPQTFDQVLARVRLGLSRRDEPPEEFAPKSALTDHQRYLVERSLDSAKRLHAEGRTVEALGFLFLPTEILAFHDGTEYAEFKAVEAYARKMLAMEAGIQGAKTKADVARIAQDKVAAELLRMHKKQPFIHQRDMLNAAVERGPNLGEEDSDVAWAKRLLKRPDLDEIYKTLAKSRAPQVNRVTR